jgi:hypothetical protein
LSGVWLARVLGVFDRLRGVSFLILFGLYVALVASAWLILNYGLLTTVRFDASMFHPFRRDLALHTLAFASLTLPALCLFRPKAMVLAGCLGFGVMLELAQFFSLRREPSLADVAADALGIAVAGLIYLVLLRVAPVLVPARSDAGAA